MVVEYIRCTVSAARAEGFVAAYQKASEILDADPHCLTYEVARGPVTRGTQDVATKTKRVGSDGRRAFEQ